jgi:molecular chaperone GrpE
LEEERRYAEIDLIRDLLPLVDNVSRAIEAAEKKADAALLLSALKMMAQQFEEVFARHHGKLITAVGEPFDPHRHEALSQGHDPAKPDHAILEVVQRGYQRGAKVVRPAKVVVNDLTLSKPARHGR